MPRHRNLVNAACVLLLGMVLVTVRSCAAQLSWPHGSASATVGETTTTSSTTLNESTTMTVRR